MEVLEMLKGTDLWDKDYFNDSILFLETSEDMPEPLVVKCWLRNYGAQGILHKVKGIIWGKPYQGKYYDEYKEVIKTVMKEYGVGKLPVVYNMTFGHNEPMMCLPYGARAEIDCSNIKFSILDSGVV